MTRNFKVLPVIMAPTYTSLMRPSDKFPDNVSVQHPAIDVMTDLSRKAAVTVDPDLPIDRAEERMRNGGVRLLFVLSEPGGLLGLITLSDIVGMRPMRFQQEMGVSRTEVLVRDVMTSLDKLEALCMPDVAEARVGDIIETLKRTGRQHAIVIEPAPSGPVIRGIFSAARIGRQLGIPLNTSGVAWTFAELEAALTH
ncbi:MAG TPA: CBS domain-containing protein [Gammaproteobacteria bacterium]|nr:CBS domain-containing protein [Gammaproteobacteria bacterium]